MRIRRKLGPFTRTGPRFASLYEKGPTIKTYARRHAIAGRSFTAILTALSCFPLPPPPPACKRERKPTTHASRA